MVDKVYSDFWLDNESLYQYVPKRNLNDGFSIDLIKLAAYRKIVSNFVYILTKKDIAVQFNSNTTSQLSFTDGKKVFLSASIRHKEDFDWSVGLALHEASHILLTDFGVLHSIFNKIPFTFPITLDTKAKNKKLNNNQLAYLCHWVWNFIEDRYIDSFVFEEAPGYRGYYKAIYNKFWNSEEVSKTIKSRSFRIPNLLAYECRILNLTNENTDLNALPGLKEIANLLDLKNILLVDTTKQRMNMAFQIAEIIVDNIIPEKKQKPSSSDTIQAIHEKLSNTIADKNIKKKNKNMNTDNSGDGDNENECEGNDPRDTSELTDDEFRKFKKQFNQQRNIIEHKFDNIKERVTEEQQTILNIIENSNIIIIPTGYGLTGDYLQASVDCVVVRKMTKELMEAGPTIFPYYGGANKLHEDAVTKGFLLGKLLGKKLKIRNEENPVKYIRKISGKIEKRLLPEIGCGNENIFHRINIERYNKIRLHISVDASGSMENSSKWCPTMTCVVAICVAASMVENLEVSVSFRSTFQNQSNCYTELPYIVLAYDSAVDKISKIRYLFPYLKADGSTPEGLTFEAIAEEFIIGKQSVGKEHYFLNLSDGEPSYLISGHANHYGNDVINYSGEIGALHTKKQIDKLRAKGVSVMSYFIKDGSYKPFYKKVDIIDDINDVDKKRQLTLHDLFDIMYGKDSQFIDVENVIDIARTINRQFLCKEQS